MEIVNKKYLRVLKSNIFMQQSEKIYNGNNEKQEFFEQMISVIFDYEKDPNKTGKKKSFNLFLEEVYISIESISKYDFFDKDELYVTRNSIINAVAIALTNEEYSEAKGLRNFLFNDTTKLNDLGDLKDYVLEHNISIDDYLNGEREKYIYNPIDKSISKGYIYSKDEIDKVKKLS